MDELTGNAFSFPPPGQNSDWESLSMGSLKVPTCGPKSQRKKIRTLLSGTSTLPDSKCSPYVRKVFLKQWRHTGIILVTGRKWRSHLRCGSLINTINKWSKETEEEDRKTSFSYVPFWADKKIIGMAKHHHEGIQRYTFPTSNTCTWRSIIYITIQLFYQNCFFLATKP